MSTLLQQLVQDHIHLEKVLVSLNRQVEHYFKDDGEEPNLNIIQDAIEYIRCYPDTFHHPLEDAILERLLEAVDDLKTLKNLQKIRDEHKVITKFTKRLAGDFNAIAHDQAISREEIEEAFTNYYELQAEHCRFENEHFLPLIDHYLGEEQLAEISASVGEAIDPLFSARRTEFDQLYQYIVELEDAEAIPSV